MRKLNIQIKYLERWFERWYKYNWNEDPPKKEISEIKKIIKRIKREVRMIAKDIRILEQKQIIPPQQTNEQVHATEFIISESK